MAILISLNILFKKHITMKKLIFSFIVVATAILVACNEEFEELTSDYTPNYRDGVYSGDNLTFTVDGEPRTVNSVTISSRQVGNDTLYSDNLKKHYLNPIYVTNVIIKGFPSQKDILFYLAAFQHAESFGVRNLSQALPQSIQRRIRHGISLIDDFLYIHNSLLYSVCKIIK